MSQSAVLVGSPDDSSVTQVDSQVYASGSHSVVPGPSASALLELVRNVISQTPPQNLYIRNYRVKGQKSVF